MAVDHGIGSYLEAEMLRPQEWAEFHQLFPAKSFRFHSEDLEVTGAAIITAIQSAPAIAEGDGPVVISRFVTHGVNSLATVTLENGEQLTGTRQHPIWCENREEWTQLAELQPGDLARSRHGLLQVAQVTLLHDTQTVYNLEVHGEHVYELLDCGILVHNSEEDCAKIASELLAPNRVSRFGEVGPSTHRQTGIVFPAEGATEPPLSKIEPLHPVPRSVKPEGYIDELADTLRGGFDRSKGTADVFRMPDGTYRMANGNHRAEAMKRLGEETIPSRVLDWKDVPAEAQKWFRERFPDLNWF